MGCFKSQNCVVRRRLGPNESSQVQTASGLVNASAKNLPDDIGNTNAWKGNATNGSATRSPSASASYYHWECNCAGARGFCSHAKCFDQCYG
mmetsp:Transcript_43887/g.136597  ORF Transcript_43887/g.136597 Transcript_43887/m.136597 type:complete len:92 (+) Transcript_43887:739-1014(+)